MRREDENMEAVGFPLTVTEPLSLIHI